MRNHTLGEIEIPEDVWWADEFGWSAVETATDRSLTGALIIHQGLKQGGRAITLTSNARGGWVSRSTVQAIEAQRAALDEDFTLLLADGRSFTVMHDHTREFEATPVRPSADLASTAYQITLPLIEV